MRERPDGQGVGAGVRGVGLIHFYPGVAPDGSMLQVSVWDTEEHSAQLNHLWEMVVVARGEMEAVGVTFTPVATYPVGWTL